MWYLPNKLMYLYTYSFEHNFFVHVFKCFVNNFIIYFINLTIINCYFKSEILFHRIYSGIFLRFNITSSSTTQTVSVGLTSSTRVPGGSRFKVESPYNHWSSSPLSVMVSSSAIVLLYTVIIVESQSMLNVSNNYFTWTYIVTIHKINIVYYILCTGIVKYSKLYTSKVETLETS